MAYTTIDDPSAYFQCTLYVGDGNGSGQAITHGGNSDLQADFIWIKNRTDAENHSLTDSVRGANKGMLSNSSDAETTDNSNGYLSSFNSDGFTTANAGVYNNASSKNYVSWNWKAGTSFTNSAGANGANLATTAGSVNTDAGFSILKWNGSGMAGEGLLAHGLGVVPSVIIIKATSASDDWYVYHKDIGATKYVRLNQTAGETSASWLENKTPTSTLISLDNGFWGTSSIDYITYCFAEKQGFSKFGSYTGNGNADGTFVYTGFSPAWIMVKDSANDANWNVFDNQRSQPNQGSSQGILRPNTSGAEFTGSTALFVDFLSNGWKLRGNSVDTNNSGAKFIYAAFAENPFVTSSGVPATAR